MSSSRKMLNFIFLAIAVAAAGLVMKFGDRLGGIIQGSLKVVAILFIVAALALSIYSFIKRERTVDIFKEGPRDVSRRALLPWLITGIGLGGLIFSLIRQYRNTNAVQTPPTKIFNAPRFRHAKKHPAYTSSLEQGFYINPSSKAKAKAIHYVSGDKKIRCVTNIKEARLQPLMGERPDVSKLRMKSLCRSYAFEQEAVSQFRLNNPDVACELLFQAITQDSDHRASFRLYDLLAGAAIRFDKKSYLDQMLRLIEIKDVQIRKLFEKRLVNWHDPSKPWHQRWSDKSRQVVWKIDGDNGLVF